MENTVIQTNKLTKQFIKWRGLSSPRHPFEKKIFTAVRDVNIEVRRGEIFGLLGPNGAGKTTLTKMMCTLILPSSGSATIAGYDLVRQQEKVKASIALVSSEERSFYWRLTGRQNLEFFAALRGISREKAARRIPEVLDQVGITEAANRRFQEYSTGMKQRLGLARGLLADPEIFFMDEPTKGLDPLATKHIHDFIRENLAARGKTVFLATHHLAEAEHVCDRVGIMYDGEMKAHGQVDELVGDFTLADYFHDIISESTVEH
ncbi:MAG: ABC transporter ATP-binding protein [Thermoleophilia bacterium]|nr:ABC transporter ATP-binding protein [Thermoleophilia bacterium]